MMTLGLANATNARDMGGQVTRGGRRMLLRTCRSLPAAVGCSR